MFKLIKNMKAKEKNSSHFLCLLLASPSFFSLNTTRRTFRKCSQTSHPVLFPPWYLISCVLSWVSHSEGHCQCCVSKAGWAALWGMSIIGGFQTGVEWHLSVMLWRKGLCYTGLRSFSTLRFYIWLWKFMFPQTTLAYWDIRCCINSNKPPPTASTATQSHS